MNKTTRFSVFYVLLAIFVLLLAQDWWVGTRVAHLPYSQYRKLLESGKVASVAVSEDQIRGTFKKPVDGKTQFVTNRVDPDLAKDLAKYDVEFSGRIENDFLANLLAWIVPMVVLFGLWILLMGYIARRAGGGAGGPGFMSIGKSKAKVYVETDTKVSFEDVAGVDEAKEELQEVVAFLRAPDSYGRLGARMPKGVLLVGPPGTGKTLLARAVAGEAGVPFFSISGSEFVEMFVGVGAARVRDLFEQARQKAPCIIFVDELDALGRARNAYPGVGSHDEKEQTLNQLLVEMDGFDPTSGIILIAATNRPEILDPALLRAGRFDRQVLVDRPDKRGRAQILGVHMRRIRIADDVDADKVADLTPGFTGADLANLVNEAALVATRRNAPATSMAHFTEAIERIVAGLEKRNRLLNPLERRVVAHHEMGHALVSAALPGVDTVHKISIIPRGVGALGYTMQRPTEERFLMTQEELDNKMAVLLGGRAAEKLMYGHLSTGAADDLSKATEIARSMVTRFGMAPELGHITYDSDPQSYLGNGTLRTRNYSEDTAREIDCAVRDAVEHAFQRAYAILEHNRSVLEDGAAELLEQETLTDADLVPLFARVEREAPHSQMIPRRSTSDAAADPGQ